MVCFPLLGLACQLIFPYSICPSSYSDCPPEQHGWLGFLGGSYQKRSLAYAVASKMKDVPNKYSQDVFMSRAGQLFSIYVNNDEKDCYTISVFHEIDFEYRLHGSKQKAHELFQIYGLFTGKELKSTINELKTMFYQLNCENLETLPDTFNEIKQRHSSRSCPSKFKSSFPLIGYMSSFASSFLPMDKPDMHLWEARDLPADWSEDTDKYLKKGDIIRRPLFSFMPFLPHAAIYIGSGEVIHFSAHNESTRSIRKGSLVGDFVKTFTDEISIWEHRIKCRTPEEVCQQAEELLKTGKGWYNLFWNNCVTVVSECSRGSVQLFKSIVINIFKIVVYGGIIVAVLFVSFKLIAG